MYFEKSRVIAIHLNNAPSEQGEHKFNLNSCEVNYLAAKNQCMEGNHFVRGSCDNYIHTYINLKTREFR